MGASCEKIVIIIYYLLYDVNGNLSYVIFLKHYKLDTRFHWSKLMDAFGPGSMCEFPYALDTLRD